MDADGEDSENTGEFHMNTTESPQGDQLERDIKALWNKAGQTTNIDGAVSRACFSNLIIYTEDPGAEPEITETIKEFVAKHPCRTILILSEPSHSESRLDVSVFTHASSPTGTRRVTLSDQVTLRATGRGARELASAVQPLLVPDLPISLWWRGVFLTQKELLEQMLGFVDRFIYDGVSWNNLHSTVPQVALCFEKYQESVAFTNFNWSRLRPWREYAADFFDSGVFEKEIWELTHARVEYMSIPGQEEGQRFRALLFVSWLAVQLQWEPVGGAGDSKVSGLSFKNRKGDPIAAELALVPQTSPRSQSIQKIVLEIQKPNEFQRFMIERDYEEKLMILSHESDEGKSIFRKVPHVESSPSELLFRELGRRTRNKVFEKAFQMASVLLKYI